MRIFSRGSRNCNVMYAGFILPATLAAIIVCTALYSATFALVSARYKMLQKQSVEYEIELERQNREASSQFGGAYAFD